MRVLDIIKQYHANQIECFNDVCAIKRLSFDRCDLVFQGNESWV